MSLFADGPNPYDALKRLLAKPERYQRNLLRLTVWCERSKCTPVRVFDLRDGLLVQCRSDADVSDIENHYPRDQKWSRRRAFFADEWLTMGDPSQRLQVVCDCLQTTTRLVDVQRLIEAVPAPGDTPRNIALAELVTSDV